MRVEVTPTKLDVDPVFVTRRTVQNILILVQEIHIGLI